MRVLLLGTGAAEGIPALFGDTPVSRHARACGGRDVRLRSSALIDDELKIDLGPDTLAQVAQYRLDPNGWSGIVFTHSHDDHFARDELQYALYPFTDLEFAPFTIYGNATVVDKVFERYPDWPFECVVLRPFQQVRHQGYTITPVAARHNLAEECLNLIVACGGRTLMYATDTGYWQEETWDFVQGWGFDGLVIECTEGLAPSGYDGHLDVGGCVRVVRRLREAGCLSLASAVVTTHHGHNGGATHAELEAALGPEGIQVGYDGMSLCL
jgi:phosphoribosyl 1,2-cyclic phosphate phosphodiesterase